jgi:hypothetical protein
MLTIFSTPKAFRGHSGIIQRNAVRSWTMLYPDVEIILFGSDEGTIEICAEFGLRHEPHVEPSQYGPPLASYLFHRAQEIARHDFLCYSNCDIILMSDFREAFERVARWRKSFLMIGKRWDADVTQLWDFDRADWEQELRSLALNCGVRRLVEIDYFVFPRGLYRDMPPLVIGRCWWDHWMVWKARSLRVAVVDCTSAAMVIHQNHEFSRMLSGFREEGSNWNYALAGQGRHLGTFLDSTHQLMGSGWVRRSALRKEYAFLSHPFQNFKNATFPLRKRLGLRKGMWRKVRQKFFASS